MERARLPSEGDDPVSVPDEDPMIDFDTDPIDVRGEADQPKSDLEADEPGRRSANADLDNTLDEFVDVLKSKKSRQPQRSACAGRRSQLPRGNFPGGSRRRRQRPDPAISHTVGDSGRHWSRPDRGGVAIRPGSGPVRSFRLLHSRDRRLGQGLIQRVVYGEELPDNEDVVVETPDRSDLPEWEDWSKLDQD